MSDEYEYETAEALPAIEEPATERGEIMLELPPPATVAAVPRAAAPGGRPRPAHLWCHGRGERYQTRSVIVKLRANSSPVRSVGRAIRASRAPEPSESVVSRLIDNGYAISADPVFDTPAVSPDLVPRHARFLASAVETGEPPRHSHGLVELTVDPGVDAHQLAAHLSAMGAEIEFAHVPAVRRPFARRAATTGPDPLASRQWAHGAVRIAYARKLTRFDNAHGITVAVVDSGIDEAHPDLAGVIAEYKNFLATESDRDFIGHGTHVAGIIAANLNNRVGIAGLCAARVLALKALPRHDKDWSAKNYYRALRYTIGRAKVLNLSLGGEKDDAEIGVLRDVIESGVVVVAAMGNEYEEGNPIEYPAAMSDVCAVGATDQLDRRATFSNTGPHIDLVAPGVEILSTTPTYVYDEGRRNYDSWDGTSMATPHVAAAAALVAARHARLTPKQIIARLKTTANLVGGTRSRRDTSYGAGRLNIENALR